MPREFNENRRKLRELILYISHQFESDPNYGSTHLYKTLFFADFLAYTKVGSSITGDQYRRESFGPVGRAVRSVRRQMANTGDLRKKRHLFRPVQRIVTLKTPVAQRKPDMSIFSDAEIELVDQVINTFRGEWRAGAVSKYRPNCRSGTSFRCSKPSHTSPFLVTKPGYV